MNKTLKAILIAGGAILLLFVLLSFAGRYSGWYGGGGMMGSGYWGGLSGGWLMVIPMLLIPFLVIWAIVALARGDSWSGDRSAVMHGESALELLRRRYARGDISKQEFEEKRRGLES